MIEDLKQLGFTNNEISVYTALLELGETTVGPLCAKLAMHRQVAYDSLDGLIKKNAVETVIKGRRNHYRVTDPRHLLEDIQRKEGIVKGLLPEINKLLTGQKRGQEIKIYEGDKAFRELIRRNEEHMPVGSETLVVTGGTERYMEAMKTPDGLERSNRTRREKNISTKIIFHEEHREFGSNYNRPNYQARYIRTGYNSPVAYQVWHESVTLISYGSDIFAIEIRNQNFREAYKNYFELLWDIAKE